MGRKSVPKGMGLECRFRLGTVLTLDGRQEKMTLLGSMLLLCRC